jgi:hypothetical protein
MHVTFCVGPTVNLPFGLIGLNLRLLSDRQKPQNMMVARRSSNIRWAADGRTLGRMGTRLREVVIATR